MNEENYNAADWSQDCCGSAGTNGANACGGDIFSCLPMPTSCCTLLRKLRAPGMCLSYRMSKRMIPDMDAEKAARTAKTAAGTDCTCRDSGTEDCTCGDDCACGNTCSVMTSSASISFRYFDAILACAAMMLMCGACCMCKKKVKK